MKVLIFDTETTGLPVKGGSVYLQPKVVQFAAVAFKFHPDGKSEQIGKFMWYVNPGCKIPAGAVACHGITDERVKYAPPFKGIFEVVREMVEEVDFVAGHNVTYDLDVLRWEAQRLNVPPVRLRNMALDTMLGGTDLCKFPGRMGSYKWPKLEELHRFLFGKGFEGAHDALGDVEATGRCLAEMALRGLFPALAAQQRQQTSIDTF